MAVLSEICSFFSASPKRQQKLASTIEEQESETVNRKTKLHSLSRTRWVER